MRLPVGITMKNTNGHTYKVLTVSKDDTLLEDVTVPDKPGRYVLAWRADIHSVEDGVRITWQQGHYYARENFNEALKSMLERHKELTGNTLCEGIFCNVCTDVATCKFEQTRQ